jgi:hypothetical protein
MQKEFVDIHLAIQVLDGRMSAHLQFFNNNSNEIYLDTKTICVSGETTRSVFEITDENNNKVKYIGWLEKRIVVPEDFISLKSGEKIETTIILNEVYKVIKGHKYTIQFSVYHPSYNDEGDLNKIESNPVEITY